MTIVQRSADPRARDQTAQQTQHRAPALLSCRHRDSDALHALCVNNRRRTNRQTFPRSTAQRTQTQRIRTGSESNKTESTSHSHNPAPPCSVPPKSSRNTDTIRDSIRQRGSRLGVIDARKHHRENRTGDMLALHWKRSARRELQQERNAALVWIRCSLFLENCPDFLLPWALQFLPFRRENCEWMSQFQGFFREESCSNGSR